MKLNKNQKKIVEENHNLIYLAIKKMHCSISEYYDVAAIALCNSALKYDADCKAKFSTYAYTSIQNSIKNEFRRKKAYKRDFALISLETSINEYSSDKEILLLDRLADDKVSVESIIEQKDFCKVMKSFLSHEEMEVLLMLAEGYSLKEISRIKNKNLSEIKKLLRNVRSKGEIADRYYNSYENGYYVGGGV